MSGAEHLGEALVPGVRVVPLHGPVRIDIVNRPGAAAGAEDRVEAQWQRQRQINPRLFDAPVLSVRGIEAGPQASVIRCELETYRRLVVQPEVETGVRQLSVTGVVVAADDNGEQRVLLGRRSHRTRMYGGMWQNCPAGGIDPEPTATSLSQEGIAAELLREVREEAGLDVRRVGMPLAIIYDETARSHDLIVPVEAGAVPETVKGWEYDELRWVETGEAAAFEAAEGDRIMAITRAVFRLMGWITTRDLSYQDYLRGQAAADAGDDEEALAAFRRSFSQSPHSAAARRIADVLGRRGDVDTADVWIAKAFELHPNHDRTAFRYAESLVRRNERDKARSVLAGILKRNSAYKPARTLLDSIEST